MLRFSLYCYHLNLNFKLRILPARTQRNRNWALAIYYEINETIELNETLSIERAEFFKGLTRTINKGIVALSRTNNRDIGSLSFPKGSSSERYRVSR